MTKDIHPVELLLLAAVAVGIATWDVFQGLARLLQSLAATAEPAPAAPAPAPAPTAPAAVNELGAAVAELAGLPVRTLRLLAREAGHRTLARSGRRLELLAVLGAA